MNKFIVTPQDTVTPKLRPFVGGKGMPLWELSAAGLPIPLFFIVTTKAYQLFLKENGLGEKIAHLLEHSRIEDISELILGADMPEVLSTEINEHLAQFADVHVAVRSSANVEDTSHKSWAGGFASYLNVPKATTLAEVKKCWASIFSERIVSYAKSPRKLSTIKMAVVVQQSINSDVSGVCFTRDPLDKEDDDIKIEAVLGLGEGLVQGEITPDRYVVYRRRTIISEVEVTPQKRKYTHVVAGGTKVVKIRPSYQQKLAGAEIKQLALLAQKIENHYQSAQDIEWCKVGETFYILQSRPVTT